MAQAELTPMQYAVLREKATERPFSGEYEHEHRPGTYVCAGCGQMLFESDAKFNSGCGWPSFTQPAAESHIDEERDISHGMIRTEVLCSKLQRPSRPCVRGRARPDRTALLHQFRGAEAAAEIATSGSFDGTSGRMCITSSGGEAGFLPPPAPGESAMSLGTILIIIVIIYLLGGFSGRFGGYGYGLGHSGMGLGGVILVVLIVLLLLGKL